MATNFIREVYYPDWLANIVLVKKVNEKLRMCVDFTDLNKASPKDSFSLPYLKCVNEEEAKYIMEEIHERIYEDHAGSKSLIVKVI